MRKLITKSYTNFFLIKKSSGIFLLIALLSAINLRSSSQVTQAWLNRDDFGGSDIAVRLVSDSAGNIYVTGSGGSLGNLNFNTIKYSPTGQTIWSRTWNGPGNFHDAPNAMTIRGNAIYITGYTEYTPQVNSNRKKDFATLKYDLDGTLVWSAFYNFSPIANWEDIAYAIDVDENGNVFITGSSKSALPQVGYRDIATIKYDANGNQLWVMRYNAPDANGNPGTNDDIPVALSVDQAGNVYVTGKSVGATTGYDYVTLKYDPNGVNLWIQRYTMPGNFADIPYAMKLDANANVYVTGASSAYAIDPSLWYDYATIKYNSNGDTSWIRRFNGGTGAIQWDEARDIAIDNGGNVYVTGFVPSPTTTGDDIYTLKYNSDGNLIWESRWDGPMGFEDHPYRMKLDDATNVYITGYSKSDGSTAGNDYATLKLNTAGQLQWDKIYNGPNGSIDNAYDLVLDPAFNVIVTGQSYNTSDDYVTIKYSQPVTTSVSTGPLNDLTLCPGQTIQVPYTITGMFNSGNVFTVQLSNAAGSFVNPIEIGSVASTSSGTVIATIPNSTATGSGYRIRIVSSDPVVAGSDNGMDISISCPVPTGLATVQITSTSAKVKWSAIDCANSYQLNYRKQGNSSWTKITVTNISKKLTGLTPATAYQWKVRTKCAANPNAYSSYSPVQNFTTAPLRVEGDHSVGVLSEWSVYPNPVSETGTIQLNLSERTEVEAVIINMMGNTFPVINSVLAEGTHSINFSVNELASGVYFVQLQIGNETLTGKIMVE